MLIVGTAVDYASKGGTANTALTPSELDKGSVGIYGLDEGGTMDVLITNASTGTGKVAATAFKGKTVKLCEGLGGGKFKVSEFFDVKATKVLASAYRAATAWQARIGGNSTSGSIIISPLDSIGNSIDIKVRERFPNNELGQFYQYTIPVNATGETQETLANKIKAAFDAGGDAGEVLFDATVNTNNTSNKGVTITAKEIGKSYVISMTGAIQTTPIVVNGIDFGSGTYERLVGFEKESQAKRGNLYTLDREYKEVPASLVVGGTYDTYILNTINSLVPGGYGGAGDSLNANVETSASIQVVFPANVNVTDTNSNQLDFETIIKALTGATFTSLVDPDPEA